MCTLIYFCNLIQTHIFQSWQAGPKRVIIKQCILMHAISCCMCLDFFFNVGWRTAKFLDQKEVLQKHSQRRNALHKDSSKKEERKVGLLGLLRKIGQKQKRHLTRPGLKHHNIYKAPESLNPTTHLGGQSSGTRVHTDNHRIVPGCHEHICKHQRQRRGTICP